MTKEESSNFLNCSQDKKDVVHKKTSGIIRQSETTIKIKFAFFRGGGGWAGRQGGKLSKTLFSWEAS